VRLLFAGTPDVSVASLNALLDSQHDVLAVLTRPDAVAGRGRQVHKSAVAERALEVGLPLLQPASVNDDDFIAELTKLELDAAPIVAFGGLVSEPVLTIPKFGWINLHFSLLPAWRGAAPVQHSIMAGDDVTGASTFLLERGLDTGPVIGVVTETIRSTDTSTALLNRLSESGAQLLVRSLDAIADGSARPMTQPDDGVSYAPKLHPADVRVDWNKPALAVDRLIRAAAEAPGAWTTLSGERLGLGPVQLVADDNSLQPGQLAVLKNELRVGTGSHAVCLGEVKPAGKRAMPAADWARGARLGESVNFE